MPRWTLVPTYAQWRKWSLPSKLTAVGAILSALGIFLTLTLSMWPVKDDKLGSPTEEASIGESRNILTSELARNAIKAMIYDFPGKSELQVRLITTPVNGLVAVGIEPPYREFPNVVLFQFDEGIRRWSRVHEGLILGIQPEISPFLDTHLTGEAIDVGGLSSGEEREFASDTAFSKGGWIAVEHDEFTHLHPSGPESYYVSRLGYTTLAGQLVDRGREFLNSECTLYDMPHLLSLSLSHDAGRFMLRARTTNGQEWTVTFTGVDGSGRLMRKIIEATRVVM